MTTTQTDSKSPNRPMQQSASTEEAVQAEQGNELREKADRQQSADSEKFIVSDDDWFKA